MFEQNVTHGPGTGTFTQHTFEIIIMLLGAFMLGMWLGWILWSRYKQAFDKLSLDNQSLTVTVDALRVELTALQTKLANSESEAANLAAQVESLTRNNTYQRERLLEVESLLDETQERNRKVETELGLSFEPDATPEPESIPLEIDLPVAPVAEVPPAVEPIVVEEDEPTLELAGMGPVEGEEHAEAFSIAAENTAEPETQPDPEPESPAITLTVDALDQIAPTPEQPPIAALGDFRDDLTVVEGIGPKIQELLFQYGIRTYRQLAETEVSRLREILASAGPQLAMHDPGTWPSQANLAANGEWDSLKSIQGFLKGGKKPT